MLRKLYNWTMSLAGRKHAQSVLAGISFIESSVFPIPPDVLLIPMIMANREKAFRLAAICTLASVAGGAFGYAIGHFLFDVIGQKIIALYGMTEAFKSFSGKYNEWGAWIVVGAGFTPFPYKVITIASGVTGLPFITFMVASVVGRALRFYLVAALLWKFGAPIKIFIEKYLGLLTFAFFVLLVGGFAAVKYLL